MEYSVDKYESYGDITDNMIISQQFDDCNAVTVITHKNNAFKSQL